MRKTKTATAAKAETEAKEKYQGTPATVLLREKVVGKGFTWHAAGEHLYNGEVKDVLGYQTLLLSCWDVREGGMVEFIQPLEMLSWDPVSRTGFEFITKAKLCRTEAELRRGL